MKLRRRLTLTDRTLSTISEKLGYPKLQDWQVTLSRSILDGKDVVFTAGTGCGKTTLLYAPLLAFRLKDHNAVGLSITPTKALGRDQVRHSPRFTCRLTKMIPGTFRPIEGNPRRCN